MEKQYPNLRPLIDEINGVITIISQVDLDKAVVIQYSAIIAGFISITIPIALDIVSRQTEVYKDKEISESFLKQWTYRYQLYIVLSIVFATILIFSFTNTPKWVCWFIILADAISIIVFILFIRLVQQYATNFEEFYSQRIKKESDEIVK